MGAIALYSSAGSRGTTVARLYRMVITNNTRMSPNFRSVPCAETSVDDKCWK
jgi:hypothetical protein